MTIPFWKYHGAGNDFILLDFTKSAPSLDISSLARKLCSRRHSIGADGVLVLCPSLKADFRMRIFNADGSEPSMCGNGIRCLAKYIFNRRPDLAEVSIESPHAVHKCRQYESEVGVQMGIPSVLHWQVPFENKELFVVHTGVPHAVLFVEKLDDVEVNDLGRKIRFHPQFSPEGVNVNFVTITPERQVALRTYERGVEAETLACGTGAAAAAFVAMKLGYGSSPVSILTRSTFDSSEIAYEQQMRFLFSQDQLEMIGGAEEVFEGAIDLSVLFPT